MGTLSDLAHANPAELAERARRLIMMEDRGLRQRILSIGLVILMPDGESVLRGQTVTLPPAAGVPLDLEREATRSWVDLRPRSWASWIARAQAMARTARGDETGSWARWTVAGPADPIEPSRMAVWVFENEEEGYRIKR